MSRRFGRNQRRAARQALADSQHQLDVTRTSLSDAGARLQKIQREMNDARRIAGEMSILFPASVMGIPGPKRDHIQVRTFNPLDRLDPMDRHNRIAARGQSLPVMLSRIDTSALRDAVHVRVRFGDRVVGYAISHDAIESTPKDILTDRLATELAHGMADQLHSTIRGF